MLLRLPARPILKIQKFPLVYVDSFAKTFLILYPSLENSTTPIAIGYVECPRLSTRGREGVKIGST